MSSLWRRFGPAPTLSIEEGSQHVDIEEAQLPYTVRRTLGSGGCSVVEEVEDGNTRQIFARKVFLLQRRNKERMKKLFENELKIIRSLKQHHHMIRIFATYTTRERLGLILSPVADGGDLDKFLGELMVCRSDPGRHEARIAVMVSIVEQAFGCLAAGLSFMHTNGIRHKDIKAHNILVHRGRVLYTDFGLSFDSSMLDNSTTEGPTDMTRRYAAPEVIAGNPRNSSSDVFSLGCVFIEMLPALRYTVAYDGKQSFSNSMANIHNQLRFNANFIRSYQVLFHPIQEVLRKVFLSEVIVFMTLDDPGARWTAHQVFRDSLAHPGFSCETCQQSSTVADVRCPETAYQGNPVRSLNYAPWTWSAVVMDTFWSGPMTET